ncbi:hypothetical protein FHS87_003568 [Roseomonas pecuniae]|uniref:Uncharacterized protein n=1 Tax=Muricoccus pecuniae TaxID=693023 RepID=A0A840Y9X1_9PROT|nr:hypothetical protein [Roseomonas pecuniae]
MHTYMENEEPIEVTPPMIQAGVEALLRWETSNDPRSANCVVAVYLQMVAAKRK